MHKHGVISGADTFLAILVVGWLVPNCSALALRATFETFAVNVLATYGLYSTLNF